MNHLLKLFLATNVFLLGCSDNIATPHVEQLLDAHRACIKGYGPLPFVIEENRYRYHKYRPYLHYFEEYRYFSSTATKKTVTYLADGYDNVLDAREYSLTNKADTLVIKNGDICYGDFEIVNIDSSMAESADHKDKMVVEFKYKLINTAPWVRGITELPYHYDDLYDDLATLKKLGKGRFTLTKNDRSDNWSMDVGEIRIDSPSEEKDYARSNRLYEMREEFSYTDVKQAELSSKSERLNDACHTYFSFFRNNKRADEVKAICEK